MGLTWIIVCQQNMLILEIFNKKYGPFKSYLPNPSVSMLSDGGYDSDENTDANMLFWLIENIDCDDWGNFEEDLGEFNFEEFVDLSNNDSEKPFHQIYNNEDNARDYCIVFKRFPELFVNWISTVKLKKSIAKDKYKLLFGDRDLFLTFNYTSVLEDVYDIDP